MLDTSIYCNILKTHKADIIPKESEAHITLQNEFHSKLWNRIDLIEANSFKLRKKSKWFENWCTWSFIIFYIHQWFKKPEPKMKDICIWWLISI